MHAPDAPGMELPGMDIPGIAASYGVQSERVTSLSELTRAVKDALCSDKPHLIEISERRRRGRLHLFLHAFHRDVYRAA